MDTAELTDPYMTQHRRSRLAELLRTRYGGTVMAIQAIPGLAGWFDPEARSN